MFKEISRRYQSEKAYKTHHSEPSISHFFEASEKNLAHPLHLGGKSAIKMKRYRMLD